MHSLPKLAETFSFPQISQINADLPSIFPFLLLLPEILSFNHSISSNHMAVCLFNTILPVRIGLKARLVSARGVAQGT